MVKPIEPGSFLATLKAFSSSSTVHGLSYVGNKSLPVIDRILWLFVVLVCGCFAAYVSNGVYQEWHSSKVVTSLTDTEMPIRGGQKNRKLDFELAPYLIPFSFLH